MTHKYLLLILLLSGYIYPADPIQTNIHSVEYQRCKSFERFISSEINRSIIQHPSLHPRFPQSPLLMDPAANEEMRLPSGLPDLSIRIVDYDTSAARHLLNRTQFGTTIEEINLSQAMGLDVSLSQLLTVNDIPPLPGEWVNEPFPSDIDDYSENELDSLFQIYNENMVGLQDWWLELMIEESLNIREMLTLFFHDHFATSADKVFFPPAMYYQNHLIRQHALENFKTLVRNMSYDPAMLVWLDNNQNRVGEINENFARELLELFTMGVGNYTQEDIIAAARAFTGYVTDGMDTYFIPQFHDYGIKVFLGQEGNWNGDDIIDMIFQHPATAEFLARKFYQWFLYQNPDEDAVSALAAIMRDYSYDIYPVLDALFSSDHFYDPWFRGAKYKDPLTLSIGTLRQFYLTDTSTPDELPRYPILHYFSYILGETPFFPPDVSGWPGYRTWINTYTLPWRKVYTNITVDGYCYDFELGYNVDVMDWVTHFPNPDDPEALIEDMCQLLFAIQPTEQAKLELLLELLDGSEIYDWSLADPNTEPRLRDVIKHMMRLSEYQLR